MFPAPPREVVFRNGADIIRLLDLSPGASAAEVGAGSGFLSRLIAREVGEAGRVVVTELDPKMIEYINDRARSEGLANLAAVPGRTDATGLEPG